MQKNHTFKRTNFYLINSISTKPFRFDEALGHKLHCFVKNDKIGMEFSIWSRNKEKIMKIEVKELRFEIFIS